MSDLTQRLREGGCGEYCDKLENEAADELERLRAELAAAQGVIADFPAIEQDLDGYKQRAERAEAELAKVSERRDHWIEQYQSMKSERDALRKRATCGCGDEFTEHDPGTCGNCLAAITAGTDALRADAERYRHIASATSGTVRCDFSGVVPTYYHFTGKGDLDAAIDATMRGKEQSND